MAQKKNAVSGALYSTQASRTLLVIFSCVAAALPFLLNMAAIWLPLAAAAVALPVACLWQYPAARVVMRGVLCLLTAAVPVLLIVLAAAGQFHTEYFVLFFASQLVLPAVTLAARSEHRFDIWFVRVVAVVNTVEAALLIAYIFAAGSWFTTVLFAAVALCLPVLTLLSFPPSLARFRQKK